MRPEFRLLSRVIDNTVNKILVGYNVIDMQTGKSKFLTEHQIPQVLRGCILQNAQMVNGKATGTEATLERLPTIDASTNSISGQPRVAIIGALTDDKGNAVGFEMLDAKGQKGKFKYTQAVAIIRQCGATNAKLVSRDNNIYISAIKGEFKRIIHQRKPV